MGSILVVDDDGEYVRSLSKRLHLLGLTAACVDSGGAALEYCRGHRPDLILLDWCLGPGITGRATLAFLKKAPQTRAIPVIVMSGLRLDPADEREALAAGARHFFAKAEIGESAVFESSFERHVRALLPTAVAASASCGELSATALEEGRAVASLEGARSESVYPIAPTILVIDDQKETADLLALISRTHGARLRLFPHACSERATALVPIWRTPGARAVLARLDAPNPS